MTINVAIATTTTATVASITFIAVAIRSIIAHLGYASAIYHPSSMIRCWRRGRRRRPLADHFAVYWQSAASLLPVYRQATASGLPPDYNATATRAPLDCHYTARRLPLDCHSTATASRRTVGCQPTAGLLPSYLQ